MPTPEQAAAARDPRSSLQHALGSVALSWQYRHFVSAPDQLGPSTAAYVYRTLMGAPVSAKPSPDDGGGGSDTLVIVLVSTLGAAALAGAVALWAHM
jgi:hypothetical protein